MLKQQNIAETLRYRTDAAPWAEVRRMTDYARRIYSMLAAVACVGKALF